MFSINDHTIPLSDSRYDKKPCKFDHNGECLICDCWPSDCAYKRYIDKGPYKWETKEELDEMFKPSWKKIWESLIKKFRGYGNDRGTEERGEENSEE